MIYEVSYLLFKALQAQITATYNVFQSLNSFYHSNLFISLNFVFYASVFHKNALFNGINLGNELYSRLSGLSREQLFIELATMVTGILIEFSFRGSL